MIGDDVAGSFISNANIATFQDDFTSYTTQLEADAHWERPGFPEIQVNISTDVIDANFVRPAGMIRNRGVEFDLYEFGKYSFALPGTGNWALRWKMTFGSSLAAPTSGAATNNAFIGLFELTPQDADDPNSFIAYDFSFNQNGTRLIELITGDNATPNIPTTVDAFATTFADDAIFFFELKRTSPTTVEATIYSDADYSLLVEKVKVTGISAAIIQQRFIRVMNNSEAAVGGTFNATVDDVEFFNDSEGQQNFFTVKGNDKAITYDVLPDLITGEITPDFVADFTSTTGWVSTDLARAKVEPDKNLLFFRSECDQGLNNIANDLSNDILATPDFEDDFSTDTWTQVGSNVFISSGVMNANNPASTSFDDLENNDMLGATISDTMWVLRWKYTATTITQGTNTNDQDVFVLISDETSTSGATNPQRHIGFRHRIDSGTNVFELLQQNVGAPTNAAQDTANFTPVQGTTYFMELIRTSGTTCELNIYSDAGFSILLDTLLATPNIALIDLRFAKVMSFSNGVNDGTLNTEVDDIKFWDGVTTPFITTVSDSAWVIRGDFNFTHSVDGTTVDKVILIGLWDGNQAVTANTAQDGIYLAIVVNSADVADDQAKAWLAHVDGEIPSNKAADADFTFDVFQPMLAGRYFYELKRTSTTTVECTIFDERGFAFPLQTITATIPATVTGLRYYKLMNRNDADFVGFIESTLQEVEIFDGVTNVCTFNTATVLEQDTAQARVNYCNSNIFYSGIDDNTNDSISIDLGQVLSDVAFVMRCTVDVTDNNVAVSSTPFHWIAISSSNSVANGSVAQDGIALRVDPTTGNYNAAHGFGTDPQSGWTNTTDFANLTVTNGKFYLEIARLNATRARVTVFSDKGFNDVIDSRNFVISASIVNLRHFKIMNRQVAATTAFWQVTVTDIQVWDVVNNVDGFADKFLLEVFTTCNQVSGVQNGNYHCNSDAQTGDYIRRNQENNGGTSNSSVETFLNTSVTALSQSIMDYLKVTNNLGIVKYTWGEKTWNGGVGVALPPNRVEHCAQWDTGVELLNKIHVFNEPGNGEFDTDSNIVVFGSD